jgi:hypothetical protein
MATVWTTMATNHPSGSAASFDASDDALKMPKQKYARTCPGSWELLKEMPQTGMISLMKEELFRKLHRGVQPPEGIPKTIVEGGNRNASCNRRTPWRTGLDFTWMVSWRVVAPASDQKSARPVQD